MPRVGEATCVPIGLECPSAEDVWPDEATLRAGAPGFAGSVLYVRADTDVTEPDGSRARPFEDPLAALDAASTGDIVALGVGTFTGGIALDKAVALVGACPTRTSIIVPEGNALPALHVSSLGAGAHIANLQLGGGAPGVLLEDTQDVTLQAIHVFAAPM